MAQLAGCSRHTIRYHRDLHVLGSFTATILSRLVDDVEETTAAHVKVRRRAVKVILSENKFASLAEIRDTLFVDFNIDIGKTTVLRDMAMLGYTCFIRPRAQNMSGVNHGLSLPAASSCRHLLVATLCLRMKVTSVALITVARSGHLVGAKWILGSKNAGVPAAMFSA